MTTSECSRYKFKWSNYDLKAYVKSREAVARKLRSDAQILTARAEQIELECAELENSLIEDAPDAKS